MNIKPRLTRKTYFLFLISILLSSENACSAWDNKYDHFFIAVYNTLYGLPLYRLEQHEERQPNHTTKKMKIEEMKELADTIKKAHTRTECPHEIWGNPPEELIDKTPFGVQRNDTNEYQTFKKQAWREGLNGIVANQNHDEGRVIVLFMNSISMKSQIDKDMLLVRQNDKCKDCVRQKITLSIEIAQKYPKRTYHSTIATRLADISKFLGDQNELQEKTDALRNKMQLGSP